MGKTDQSAANASGSQKEHVYPVILHLSDLHFNHKESPQKRAERERILDELTKCVAAVDDCWRPTIVCISGDVAFQAAHEDYLLAHDWLRSLLQSLNIDSHKIVLCPGNHDVDRELASRMPRPRNAAEANRALEVPIVPHYLSLFAEFAKFCDDSRIPPLEFGESALHLVGGRAIDGVHFVVCNSCWLSQDDADDGKLWMGLPHLRFLEGRGCLPVVNCDAPNPATIALVHHPRERLHESEYNRHDPAPGTFEYLSHRCHLILSGHAHGGVGAATRTAKAWCVTAGAAHRDVSHRHNFHVIRITESSFEVRTFESDPGSPDGLWQSGAVKILPFREPADLYSDCTRLSDENSLLKSRVRELEPKQGVITGAAYISQGTHETSHAQPTNTPIDKDVLILPGGEADLDGARSGLRRNSDANANELSESMLGSAPTMLRPPAIVDDWAIDKVVEIKRLLAELEIEKAYDRGRDAIDRVDMVGDEVSPSVKRELIFAAATAIAKFAATKKKQDRKPYIDEARRLLERFRHGSPE